MSTIGLILSIVGLISVILTVLRACWVFAFSNVEWVDSISITRIEKDEDRECLPNGECIFPQEYSIGPQEYAESYLIRPNNRIINKMYISEIKYNDDYSISKYVDVEELNDISPYRPLIISVEGPEIFPNYALRWSGDYGAKAIYEFYPNGRDNNYNRTGIVYRFGFFQKLRKVLGLR